MNDGHGSQLPGEWLPRLIELLRHQVAVVRVVVAEARGSTPREAGAFMLIGENLVLGSIGGGRLEWEAIAAARELLIDARTAAQLRKSVLGIDLGQCCGGVVSTWLDRFTRADLDLLRAAAEAAARGPAMLVSTLRDGHVERRLLRAWDDEESGLRAPSVVRDDTSGQLIFRERLDRQLPAVWLYGAGHVGQALARVLIELPLRLIWIDSRSELRATAGMRYEPDVVASVSEAPVGAYFLVMTHSHPLDFRLCHEVLQRDDFAWLGLIGSESKSARFRSRLRREGVDASAVARLVCPIGIAGVRGKWPAVIAVAVAAQVMREISAPGAPSTARVKLRLDSCPGENCSTCGRSSTRVTS
ncbi:MAG: xanthine dehydrogenase accessory protein XdhC [Steroidobacteraceae bacterium]